LNFFFHEQPLFPLGYIRFSINSSFQENLVQMPIRIRFLPIQSSANNSYASLIFITRRKSLREGKGFRTKALQNTHLRFGEGWSRALDLRDRETEGHTLRVTGMTLRLAREMGVVVKLARRRFYCGLARLYQARMDCD
jgi:hypothetical protein